MEAPYETVYVVEDWYDGPRSGFANYQQQPHFYRSLFLDIEINSDYDPDENRFELTPVSEQVVEWAVASHYLWLKWNEAYRAGTIAQEANDEIRILPEDRVRYQELCEMIEQHRNEQVASKFIVRGKFEIGSRRVQWYDLDQALRIDI